MNNVPTIHTELRYSQDFYVNGEFIFTVKMTSPTLADVALRSGAVSDIPQKLLHWANAVYLKDMDFNAVCSCAIDKIIECYRERNNNAQTKEPNTEG